MSWNKPVWTAEEIKNYVTDVINRGDAGKDLYIAGIKRGRKATVINITGSSGNAVTALDLSGASGIVLLIQASCYVYQGSNSFPISGSVLIDGKQTVSASGTISGNGSFSVDSTKLYSEVDIGEDFSLTTGVISNCPLRFKNSLKVTVNKMSYSNTNSRFIVWYMLDDEEENVGGVTRKPAQIIHARITAPNPDFAGRGCAA